MALRDQVPDLRVGGSFFTFPTAMSSNIDQYPDQHPVPRQNRSHCHPHYHLWHRKFPSRCPCRSHQAAQLQRGPVLQRWSAEVQRPRVMNLMPAKCHPILRPETAWSGATLDQIIKGIENIESALTQVVGVPTEQPCIPCQRSHGLWNTCVVLEGNSNLTACAGCGFEGNDIRCTHYQPLHPDKIERECRDREIDDHREDIGWLQKRITESNVARNEPSSVWGFKHWLLDVQIALANLNLLAVISHGIQRPTPEHPHYEN
ncbi:hypothetical protein N7501_005542 [Penicillium viridicatum]|nr:hypothetical protein N7501_005542 [Penicillium viridicatum]